MAAIYIRAINDGRITIDKVPKRWRAEVQKMLIAEASSATK